MKRVDSFLFVIFGIILNLGSSVLGRDICDVYGGSYTYCDRGYHCCNDNTQCCADGLSVGAVIGIVFGVIFLVCVCVFCTLAVTKKKKLRPNQLVRPYNQPNVPISTIGTNAQGQNYLQNQHFYPYGQPNPYGQPLSYGQNQVPASGPMQPPPYSQADNSAFPPPPAYKLEP